MLEAGHSSESETRLEAKLEQLGWAVAVVVAIAVVLRFDTFFGTSVDDWDEAVYLLMAQSVHAGHAPYTQVWDHKPPGLYLLIAAFFRVFGEGIFAVRILGLLAAVGMGLTMRALWKGLFGRMGLAGWIATLLAMFFSQRYGGRANVEIYFLPFTTMGMALVLPLVPGLALRPPQRPALQAVLAGLMFGIAFQLKYVIGFDLIAVALTMVIGYARLSTGTTYTNARSFLTQSLILIAGFALPWVAVFAYFVMHGAVDEYVFANFSANSVHASTGRFGVRGGLAFAGQIFDELSFFFALTLVLYPMTRLTRADKQLRALAEALSLWALFAVVAVFSPGKAYTHYALQPTPALACASAFAIDLLVLRQLPIKAVRVAIAAVTVAAGAGAFAVPAMLATLDQVARLKGIGHQRRDFFAEIGDHLRPRLGAGETIFVLDAEPIIYFTSGVRPPTRYVFPPFLLDEHFIAVAAVDAPAELERIFAQRPAFVVRKHGGQLPEHAQGVSRHLAADYEPEREMGGYDILRRKR